MGWGEEYIGWCGMKFSSKSCMGPETGEGDIDVGDMRVGGEEIWGRWLIEVEANLMISGRHREQVVDEKVGVCFCAGTFSFDCATGVYADDHSGWGIGKRDRDREKRKL